MALQTTTEKSDVEIGQMINVKSHKLKWLHIKYLLGASKNFRKRIVSFVIAVCLAVRMEQFGSN
jgi:hypothetical protein